MRLLFFFFLTCALLFGRDNPFFPADPNEKQMPTSNKIENLKPFSTQQISLPSSARAIKGLVIHYQNMDGSIASETLELNNKIDWHMPLVLSHGAVSSEKSSTEKSKSKSVETKHITFVSSGKTLKLITKDKMLRNFMLTSPHRIVMDFARDTSFKPQNYTLNTPPFKRIRLGNHDKYYRAVVELDGQYGYALNVSANDYTIVCR